MDLLELSTTEKFEFINPKTKKSTNSFIEISYPDTRLGNRNTLAIQRQMFKLTQDENNLEDGQLKQEILEQLNFEYLASMIVSWENITINKKKLDCNFENAKKLLENELIFRFVNEKFIAMGKLIAD